MVIREDVSLFLLHVTPFYAYTTTRGSWVDSSWFALDTSRGTETPDSKVFMRATVLLSDLLVYVPAVLLFVRRLLRHRSGRTQVSCPSLGRYGC